MLGLPLTLVSGEKVCVIDPGVLNRDSGPDFFNAKVRIGSHLWVGNVEIHLRASDWHRHRHDDNPAYDNVILHVVSVSDVPVARRDGSLLPQMEVSLPQDFYHAFGYLTSTLPSIRCASRLGSLPVVARTDWIESLTIERLQAKAARVGELLRDNHGDWNSACFITLARGMGFGLNSIPFEMLAKSISLNHLRRHSDNILQLESIFFGQAGLLDRNLYSDDMRYQLMCREYQFLAAKYGMTPIPRVSWKFSRTRPQNFPYRRIATLARAMADAPDLFQRILAAGGDEERLRELFRWQPDAYWTRRLTFGGGASAGTRQPSMKEEDSARDTSGILPPVMSDSSIDILLINVVAPLMYSYALLHSDHDMKESALSLLLSLPPERNAFVRDWQTLGIKPRDAAESQALLHLRREYCDRHDCLRCRFAHHILRRAALSPCPQCH